MEVDYDRKKEGKIPEEHEIRIKHFFHRLFTSFTITGERRVPRRRLTGKDFELPESYKVAQYDPEFVAEYWNARNISRPLWMVLLQFFTRGIVPKLVPVSGLYLFLYYFLNIYVFNFALCEKPKEMNVTIMMMNGTPGELLKKPAQEGLVRLALSGDLVCQRAKLEQWISMERDFTRILTFFIGFTVSSLVNSYFQQIRMIPKLDQLLVQMNNFMWVNPKWKVEDVKIKANVTAKQLRFTIVRYFLLSWTMCCSRMSRAMNKEFKREHALNRKRLLLKREFNELRCGIEGCAWREKWATPLSWVTKIVNDIEIQDKKSAKTLDIKDAIGKTIGAYCNDLQKLNSYNEYRMPNSLISLLTVTVFAYMILNVAAAQDMHPEEITEDTNMLLIYIFDFPWFALVKYLMIYGWLEAATDLMCPYGPGRFVYILYTL